MIRIFAVLSAVCALALVAGCGGGDDETTAATIGKAEFAKQGNAICKAGNVEVEKGFEGFAEENDLKQNQRPTDAQLEEAAEEVLLPSIGKQIDEISELGVPEGEEDAYETFIANAEAELERVEDDPSLLTAEGENTFKEVNKEARALGLPACGEEG